MNGLFSVSSSLFQSAPSHFEISELCILGLSCAMRRRCPRDQTMNAFIGRFTCSLVVRMTHVVVVVAAVGRDSTAVIGAVTEVRVRNVSEYMLSIETTSIQIQNDNYSITGPQ